MNSCFWSRFLASSAAAVVCLLFYSVLVVCCCRRPYCPILFFNHHRPLLLSTFLKMIECQSFDLYLEFTVSHTHHTRLKILFSFMKRNAVADGLQGLMVDDGAKRMLM